MIRKGIANIPNLITLMNLLSGIIAIIFAFKPSSTTAIGNCELAGWQWAALMIGCAAVFDFIDGASARLLHAKSSIGKELDSLADVVSFGVAPSIMLMNVLLEGGNSFFISYLPLFIALMGALRLAKFNVDDSQTTSFKGLPIPANAIFWIGIVASFYSGLQITAAFMAALIIVVGLLMVSNFPMFSLKFANFKLRENLIRYIQIIGTIVAVCIWGLPGLAIAILLYILLSVAALVIRID